MSDLGTDHTFIQAMNQEDAHKIGFTIASEQTLQEKIAKENLLKSYIKDKI